MIKILNLLLFINLALFAKSSYVSLTQESDKNGHAGFREQIESVPEANLNGSDITLGTSYTFPYNANKIPTNDNRYNDITWCTNGMLRVKVYVPPHLDSLQIVMQILPLNSGIGFATYVPMGQIDEYEAQSKKELGKTAYLNKFWTEHKTVSFAIDNVYSIVLNDYARSKYSIDESEGGYLYLSFSQSSKINPSAKDFDARYKMAFSLYYDFKHPFTQEMRNDILSKIPNGLTEPVENAQTLITRECSATQQLSIVTEEGVAKSAEEICDDTNGVYFNNTCYYFPSDQAKYDCEVTDGDVWSGNRCITDAETSCNSNSEKKWYIAGNECLERLDEISTASSYDMTQPTTLLYDKNETTYKMAFYRANAEDWETELKLSNNNATSTTTQKVTILNEDMSKSLLSFNVNIDSAQEWSGYIYEKNNKLYFDAPLPGNNDANSTQELSEYVTKGIILVEPAEQVNMDTDQLNVNLKYGLNLLTPAVTLTQAQQDCSDNGGTWTSALGCIGAPNPVSSVSAQSSSATAQASSATSLTQAQQNCSNAGGSWTNALGCIGGTFTPSSVAQASSSASAQSSVATSQSSSVSLTQAQTNCTNNGGVWTSALGCIGATQSSVSSTSGTSSTSGQSSSVSLSQAQTDCKNQGGTWTSTLGCLGGVIPPASQIDNATTFEVITSYIEATKTYKIDGWLARYDFINVDDELDWVFVTKTGKVYQLQGDRSNGVFGWKRVYITPVSKTYALVQIGDWDSDGDGSFDWIAIDEGNNRVYKINGVNSNGRFTFLDNKPIAIEFEISKDQRSVTFK